MKQKRFYVLATIAILVFAAGCQSKQGEENPQNKVTEVLSPTETPEATATPEPTATPAPTATPVPANYMEANGIEVLGGGWHTYKAYIWNNTEGGKELTGLVDFEAFMKVSEEDNGDGTKTIRATLYSSPYIDKDTGNWWSNGMGGFVDLQSGKAFFPMVPDMEQSTVLKQDEKSYEVSLTFSGKGVSTTSPYYTEEYTLICPSDYEDAGFYMTGYNLDPETYTERAGFWKKLNYIRHGESDMLVFGVNRVLETLTEAEEKPLPEPEGNYFEANGLTTKGEGTVTWFGTEGTQKLNKETGEWEITLVETKEIELEVAVTEESLGDGTKLIKGMFNFTDVMISEEEIKSVMGTTGVVDKKSGLVYTPRTYFLAEPYVMEKDGKEVFISVAVELFQEKITDGKLKTLLTYWVVCPEDYDDAVFFLTGKYEFVDEDFSGKKEVYSVSDIDHGESQLLFFR